MSATTPTAGRPSRCPDCGRTYAFRVRTRIAKDMNLTTHYRCTEHGGYVYVHEINFKWSRMASAAAAGED